MSDSTYVVINDKREELEKIRALKMEGVLLRSRGRWLEKGEKPTKFFLNLEKRNFISKSILELHSDHDGVIDDPSKILDEVSNFYSKLYTKDTDNEVFDLNKCFLNNKVHTLIHTINFDLNKDDISESLYKMSNNKSPGLDGWTVEFFKFFWKDLSDFILRSFNNSFANGELPSSLTRGVITLIPKPNKDRRYIKNWRPITLLPVLYKILSSCIANRLKIYLPVLINSDQKGFLQGRYIGENIRLLYDLMYYTENNDMPGLLLSVDFEKAFDCLRHNFIWQVLSAFGFDPIFIRWCKLLYHSSSSCVSVNGSHSTFFAIDRGCRQGDPISPYLFILCAEVLSILARNDCSITGITVGSKQFKICQYGDDTVFILDGTELPLRNVFNILQFFFPHFRSKSQYRKKHLLYGLVI